MSSPPQPASARRRTFDYSHQPEQGLHEWASRIKSIQAEVDQDEQAEQQRLEEEIVASRIARAQRRAKQGSRRLSDIGPSAPPDPDPMKTPESPTKPSSIFGARATLMSPSTPGKTDPDILPESPTKSAFGSTRTMTTNPPTGAKQTMSLAALMGSRGSGPRLNKPAPLVDTHDSTLFDQTRRAGPSGAANAFQAAGRVSKWGQGVALPGLGPPPRQPSPTPRSPRSPRFASPEDQPMVPQHTRQRTTSSPEKPGNPLPGSSPETKSELTRSKTTVRTRTKSTSSPNSPPKERSDTLSPAFSTPTRNTPLRSHTTPTRGSSPTPGLARPIQPTPPAQDPNKLPLVSSATPAFRSTVQASAKELSPSLTRLKGRGFVGNRVRQADGGASSPPSSLGISTNQFGEREKPTRGSVGNVHGRWRAAIQGQQSSSPQPASPVEVPWKRRSLKEPVPVPGDSKIAGIIKHITGAPSYPAPPSPQKESPPIDEFGPRASPVFPKATLIPVQPTPEFESAESIQPQPLNHLTRDRARKPKKVAQIKDVWNPPQAISTTPVDTPPQDHRPPSPFKRLRPATSQPSMRPPSPIKESSLRRQGTLPKAQSSPTRAAANPSTTPPSPLRKPAQLFPITPRPESPTKESHISRAKDLWGERAPIGIKPQNGGKRGASPGPAPRGPNPVGKRALPGMIAAPQPQQRAQPQPLYGRPESPTKPSTPKPVSPISPPRHAGPPPSPGRNKSRATVMELAQAMIEKQGETLEEPKMPPSPRSVPAAMRERRRSSYDRYSVVTMPPLKEERTPGPTPAGTLSKSQELSVPAAEPVPASTSPKTSPRISPKPSPRLTPKAAPKALSPRPSPKVQPAPLPVENKVDEVYRVDQNMSPIPPFNLQQVINANPYNFTFPSNFKRISTDVFSLSNDRATLVTSNPCLVYDSELVAVVQRVRNETNGLVLSKVWGWCGRKAQPGGKEEGKLVELAKQYGTSVIPAFQGDESQELVDAVGGHWITRQGTRAHWTPENTTMHCTRRLGDACFTDEVDFHVSNICSAYSYCVTALDAVYVWHGRGTTQLEREAATAYGRMITGPEKEIEEFDEGKEDPMFFMLLGDDAWANTDYWKYRAPLGKVAYRPRMFLIDARNKKQPVSCHIPSVNRIAPDTIFVLDGMLEMIVMIGPEARARRTDILLAVHIAISVATSVESKRPFVPPVHLVVLPSKLPLEVKAGFFRFVSDELVNPAGVPSHMHLLTLSQASEQLSTLTLPISKLRDPTFLPLGIHPSLLN